MVRVGFTLGLGLGSDCGARVRVGFRYRVLGCRECM